MKRSPENAVDPGGPGVPGGVVRRDKANPTQLGNDPRNPKPFVDPAVTNPAALSYAIGAEGRRRNNPLPKYTDPVAGGPDLPIPLLSGEASGGTMVEQARQQRGMPAPGGIPALNAVLSSMAGEPAVRGGGIVEGTEHQQAPAPVRAKTAAPNIPSTILRDDMLPDQATKDPNFRQGPGSMYAVNQHELALRYGVMRNGKFVPPQQLRSDSSKVTGKLSPESVEGLQAIAELQKAGDKVSSQQEESAAMAGPAGGAGKTERPLTEADKKQLLDDMDEFELSRLKNALFKDMLNNDEQRQVIESRLKPLDLDNLIITGQVSQNVPIHPGKFEAEFQSYAAEEDLRCKRMIGEEAATLKPSDRYLMDKYHLMGLTIAIRAINRMPLPDYRDEKGDFDEDKFWAKYAVVARLNYHMMASLMVNWFWFDMRVRKLFRAETLGNG